MSSPISPFAHFGGHISPAVKAFKEMSEILYEKLDGIDQRLTALEQQVNSTSNQEKQEITSKIREEFQWQTNWLYDEMERHNRSSATRDAHTKIYLDQIFREDGEAFEDAKRRLFAGIAPAEGATRLSQLATAKLMDKLDQICTYLGIDYWLWAGTLLASHYRKGSIPWDDDIDICMMREDIDKLDAYLKSVNTDNVSELGTGFQVTTVYDRIVFVKQKRFCSTDPAFPCFIDLVIWDYGCNVNKETQNKLNEIHIDMIKELNRRCSDLQDPIAYWNDHHYLAAEDSGLGFQCFDVVQDEIDADKAQAAINGIEEVFAKTFENEVDCGCVFASKPEKPIAIVYAHENLHNAPWRQNAWEYADVYPVVKEEYESYLFSVPANAEKACQLCYPGSPYLPNDIIGHEHFAAGVMERDDIIEKMQLFVQSE